MLEAAAPISALQVITATSTRHAGIVNGTSGRLTYMGLRSSKSVRDMVERKTPSRSMSSCMSRSFV